MSTTKPKQKIRSLKALEAEKARLRESMQRNREQALAAYGGARKKAPAYVLKKAAVPAGIAGISALAFRRNRKAAKAESYAQSHIAEPQRASGGGIGAVLFSMLMALVEDWISKKM